MQKVVRQIVSYTFSIASPAESAGVYKPSWLTRGWMADSSTGIPFRIRLSAIIEVGQATKEIASGLTSI